jgi:hypothetical protein
MDPYLEGSLWTTVHAALAIEIAHQLVPKLRPRYVALPVERFVLDVPDDVAVETREMYPDVGAVRTGWEERASGANAVAAPPLRLATVIPTRVPQVNVEIRDTKNRRLVTAIEILSPTNKRKPGRREYLAKRLSLLRSSTHLIELDLVRKGRRVPMRQRLPAAPYFALVGRVESRPILEVWPIGLADPLPEIPVPLLPGDADVFLNLHSAFGNVYDLGGYDLLIDYTQQPEVRLAAEAQVWVDQHLHAAGKRP